MSPVKCAAARSYTGLIFFWTFGNGDADNGDDDGDDGPVNNDDGNDGPASQAPPCCLPSVEWD